MIKLHYIFTIFLIVTLFLPLSFLSKKLSYFRFDFFIQVIALIFIYFIFDIYTDLYLNIIVWLFVIYLSWSIQFSANTWEWFFLFIFIYIALYLYLIGFISNFLGLFILLEAQVIVFLMLTQLENNSIINIEAIARWCLINIVSSLFLIFSLGLLYQLYGTINIVDLLILDIFTNENEKLALILFYSSFLFKIGIPPFHFWLPDIYETGNVLLVSTLIAPIKLFYIMILQFFVILNNDFNFIFLLLGFVSILIGLLITLNQFIIKKFLAWTGIFYFGSFLILLANLNIENIFYLKIYMIIYLFSSLIFILMTQINVYKLSDIINVFSDNFRIGFFFLSLLIIIMGLPIMAGFYSKLSFFFNLILSTNSFILVLLILILTSFAGFYYLNLYIYSLSFKYLLSDFNLIESINTRFNLMFYIVLMFIFFLTFYPYQLSCIFLYLV